MRARFLLLLTLAIALAGGTAWLANLWPRSACAKWANPPGSGAEPARSVLIARAALRRGQILRPEELIWQIWPTARSTRITSSWAGRAPGTRRRMGGQEPVSAGEPITDEKIIAPGDRGFLAAVLDPGMRAISVPVTVISGISGFVSPGDRVESGAQLLVAGAGRI